MSDNLPPQDDWFADAPTGDIPLDQLFPDPNGDGQQPAPTVAVPQQTLQEQFFLKTPTGTVYKTASDAIDGISHKDNLIAKLRADSIARSGYDPLTGKQVRQPEPAPASAPASNQPVVYSQSPKNYWDDIVTAAQKGDYESYARIQSQLVDEKVNERLGPYAPLIATVAKQSAVEQVSSSYPGFRNFYGSEQYNKALEALPLVKDAIQAAESNPQMAAQLGQLYTTTYLAAQGLRLSEPPSGNPPMVNTQQPAPRPTLTSTPLPPPSDEPRPQQNLATKEGRLEAYKQTQRDQEAKGVLDLKF